MEIFVFIKLCSFPYFFNFLQANLSAEMLSKEIEFEKIVKLKKFEHSEIIKKMIFEKNELMDRNNALSRDIAALQNVHAEYSVLTQRMKHDMLESEVVIRFVISCFFDIIISPLCKCHLL